jgi:peptidoglycan/LPS O-acetylase OafA/YrhL
MPAAIEAGLPGYSARDDGVGQLPSVRGPLASTGISITSRAVSSETRVVCLDGLRGMMTILVVVSHYFAEVPHGVKALMMGWIAVDMFFVLSGYLVGKLIIEKKHHANFLSVFYVRRACRTLPIYAVCVALNALLIRLLAAPWVDADLTFPLWSYLSFTQNFFMAQTGSIGAHWLSPTWTLAIEEHFYLVVPVLFFFVPRERMVKALLAGALAAVAIRAAIFTSGAPAPQMIATVLLPARADVLICGLLAAVAIKSEIVPWHRVIDALRLAPILLIAAVAALRLADGTHGHLFGIVGPTLTALACTAFLLALVRNAPEAARFRSRMLCFFGEISYAVYLIHLPVLGLMHGLVLGGKPDIATAPQWAVTAGALPLCVILAWALTRAVEQPLTRYGRTWDWNGPRHQEYGT